MKKNILIGLFVCGVILYFGWKVQMQRRALAEATKPAPVAVVDSTAADELKLIEVTHEALKVDAAACERDRDRWREVATQRVGKALEVKDNARH